MAKKVLVLGGTGAIGLYTVPELLKRGYEVHVTTRSSRASDYKNLEYIQGDAQNIQFLETILTKQYDVIIDFMIYSTDNFRLRVETLLSSCNQYIYLSSYRVFSDTDVITERSPRLLDVIKDGKFLASDEYALAKARQEDILRATGKKNWTIVRPSITYSVNRYQFGTMEQDTFIWRSLHGGQVPFPVKLKYKTTTLTWAGDTGRQIAKLVLNKDALGEDFNIATQESHTWEEIADVYKRSLKLDIKYVSLRSYFKATGGGMNDVYLVKYNRMYDRTFDNSKILSVTGERQEDMISLEVGLRKELNSFLRSPSFTVDYRTQARFDKVTGSRINLDEVSEDERIAYYSVMYFTRKKIKSIIRKFVFGLGAAKRAIRARTRIKMALQGLGLWMEARKFRNFDGAIITLTGYFNYGNVLQRYALQKFLRNSGYNFVSYVDSFSAPRDMYRIGRKARLKTPIRAVKRLFSRQRPYWYTPSFGELYPEADRLRNIINFVNKNIWIKSFSPGDDYRNYIVGSDQVWRDWWGNREAIGYYFFNFLKDKNTNRVAYAASFGKDRISEVIKPDDIDYLKPYVEQFNKISVREKSGIKMIQDAWGVGGVDVVVDPTLLLDASDYSELIDGTDVRCEKIQPIFSYVLGEVPEVEKFIKRIQDGRKQALTKISAHQESEDDVLPPVELWLKGFRDAELVITNSFHGMMFSVINNTDFIVIGKEAGGLSRVRDFLNKYGIEGRFVDEADVAKFDIRELKPIDWKSVNAKLEIAKKESSDWLLDAVR